jgi:hypothetical protein
VVFLLIEFPLRQQKSLCHLLSAMLIFVDTLCTHLLFMGVMLEARDENNTGLPFGCLLTQIILQSGISVTREPKMKIQDPISKQTLMKSNAQLR